jgi:hypothetical protein
MRRTYRPDLISKLGAFGSERAYANDLAKGKLRELVPKYLASGSLVFGGEVVNPGNTGEIGYGLQVPHQNLTIHKLFTGGGQSRTVSRVRPSRDPGILIDAVGRARVLSDVEDDAG